MKPSTKENVEGKIHHAKGKIKEIVGKAVGNRDLEAEGKVEKLDGIIQRSPARSRRFLASRRVFKKNV